MDRDEETARDEIRVYQEHADRLGKIADLLSDGPTKLIVRKLGLEYEKLSRLLETLDPNADAEATVAAKRQAFACHVTLLRQWSALAADLDNEKLDTEAIAPPNSRRT